MTNTNLSPVSLFVYKRLDTLKRTVAALKRNYLASETDLHIFSDAAKATNDEDEIKNVRSFIKTISGFKNVYIYESDKNQGLANSIINGVTRLLRENGKVIVLEDDLETSSNFLSYMNQGLEHYKDLDSVFSISGYSLPIEENSDDDVYFTKRSSSWGWATWKERWEKVDWEVTDYKHFKDDAEAKKAFDRMGSDLSSMLKRQMDGQMDSWAIRWCFHQFQNDLYSVYPTVSKVRNIGFGEGATHTFDYFNRYDTKLDQSGKQIFTFAEPHINKKIIKKFVSPYALSTRFKYKALNTLVALYKKMRTVNFSINFFRKNLNHT